MLNHIMVHIASRLSKEMSQNVDDIRIKQPIPEAAIDITANLSLVVCTKNHKRESVTGCHRLHDDHDVEYVCNSIHFANLAVSFPNKKEKLSIFLSQKLQVHASAA